ncbi:MAG: PilC/PilY family type IV pilus protein, partial [Pseudomonadota bacterium]|nr:PilC/PilY family type IV pilus protein [Pseudomonadota bacterium]
LDDSGSMDWEVLKTRGALAAHPSAPNSGNLDFTPNNTDEDRELCAGYNATAYDPNATYTPWIGTNSAGSAYVDRTLTTARWNPYSSTSNTDLSNHVYGVWKDANGNGEYDSGECPFVSGKDGDNFSDRKSDALAAGFIEVKNLTAARQTNYANWYSYYRKREYVLKRAVSELIWDSSSRMGVATLHDNEGVGTPVQDMTSTTNRDALLRNLFRINSTGNTPLRLLLRNTGRYFDDRNSDSHADLGFTTASPILSQALGGECQQNFAVLMTDGYWNGDSPGVSHQDRDTSNKWVDNWHRDTIENTVADVAMKYYKTDLSSLAGNLKAIPGVDENTEQHLVTFGVAFGVDGTLTSNPTNKNMSGTYWPSPWDGSPERIDDLRHAAWNGRGQFLSAKDPQELTNALKSTFAAIEDRRGSAAAVTFNTSTLDTDSQVFVSQFDSARWKGNVLAYDLDPSNGEVSATPDWRAADVLDAMANPAQRVIYSANATDGILFDVATASASPALMETLQLQDLIKNPDGTNDTSPWAESIARIEYIRGDRTHENPASTYNFRQRDSRLGDVVHSAPQYIGYPQLGWPDVAPFPAANGTRYSDFVASQTSSPRDGMLYVGANDGMLHGFRVSDGQEMMAYIPNAVYSNLTAGGLHHLTDATYAHNYYVDNTPAVSDVYVKTTVAGTPSWRTLLVGSLRGGGRGLFALDVTDPSNFSNDATGAAATALWEFTDADDADLGYSFSEPTVAMMNNGKWAVIFGNGYNDAGSGTAQLFILFIEEGLDGAWTLSTDYVKLDTGNNAGGSGNGLGSPAVVDLDGDSDADRIYAGDLQGNLWVFDVSNGSSGSWAVAYSGNPLFDGPDTQQITSKPVLARLYTVPNTVNNTPNVMVYFGTGQYLTQADNATTTQQSFYGIWDGGTGNLGTGNLVQQTFITDAAFPADARVLSSNAVSYAEPPSGGNYGWRIDLPDSGERVVVNAVVRGDLVYFNTLTPSVSICSSGGSGYLMSVNLNNGGNPPVPAFDFNRDNKITAADMVTDSGSTSYAVAGEKFPHGIPAGSGFLSDYQYTAGTGTTGQPVKRMIIPLGSANTGRLSWQELTAQ